MNPQRAEPAGPAGPTRVPQALRLWVVGARQRAGRGHKLAARAARGEAPVRSLRVAQEKAVALARTPAQQVVRGRPVALAAPMEAR